MPLITASHDSLPYLDRPLTPSSLAAANALITTALASTPTTTPHPSLPPAYEPTFTALAASEQSRQSRKEPLRAIDLARYEPPSPPPTNNNTAPAAADQLAQAATAASYLGARQQQLSLLGQFGKNAWLVHNSQLEGVLRDYEKELVETREAVTAVNRERKGVQEGARGEVEGLERAWREGVRRVVEVEIGVVGVEEGVRGALRREAER